MHLLISTVAIELYTDWFSVLIAKQRKPILSARTVGFMPSDRKRFSFDDVKLSIHTYCEFCETFNRVLGHLFTCSV